MYGLSAPFFHGITSIDAQHSRPAPDLSLPPGSGTWKPFSASSPHHFHAYTSCNPTHYSYACVGAHNDEPVDTRREYSDLSLPTASG